MARIKPLSRDEVCEAMGVAYDEQIEAHGRITHMKRTLAHSPQAFHALMTWYPLFDEIAAFLTERRAIVFAHAISSQTDCLICSTFFRRIVHGWGEDPDQLELDEQEQLLVEWGRQLVRDANDVNDALYHRLSQRWSPKQIVSLTAFAGIMIATNVFNNALRVDLDEYLFAHRKGEEA